MFSDPVTITVNAVAQTLGRVSTGNLLSVYRKSDGTFRLEISHQVQEQKKSRNTTSGVQLVKSNVVRSVIKFIKRAIVADPVSNANDYEEAMFQLQITRPEVGFTTTELDQQWAGFKAWVDSTNLAKLLGLES